MAEVFATSEDPLTGLSTTTGGSLTTTTPTSTTTTTTLASTTITTNAFPPDNVTTAQPPLEEDGICKLILYKEIGESRVRVWDLLLLLPTLLFLIGLLVKINSARLKLRAVHSPIYATFYGLIWLNTLISVARCVVSMTVNAATPSGDVANKLLYVIVRFFLLATEMSVVVFAIFFGHLDNKTSIRRVLVVTSMIAMPYSVVQGALEVITPDHDFDVPSKDYELFGHGGSLFWLISSIIFTLIYSFILVLRLDCLRKRFLFLLWMPMKRAFYVYLGFLAGLNLIQSIGSGLYHVHIAAGLCLVNATTWTYFSLLTPFIYYTFISEFFGQKSREQVENIVFSYKSEDDDDTSSLPLPGTEFPQQNIYQSSSAPYSSLSEEGVGEGQTPVNPLYSASLQSPDSITGYSINSVDDITINAYNKSQTQ
ncbi:transmembrane protein adipocyte-associated 1-like [Panulirus ornatus]|uniref:transmembrane protein adipocyte-associated 1-like n=1 Tax=Panulirus ornatus TaxID=150431 RepID=UPI003A8A9A7A